MTLKDLLAGGTAGSPLLAAMILLAARPGLAQETAESPRLNPESLPYTFKAGDFRALLIPSLGLDWNDNVRLSQGSQEDDFILRPLLSLSINYPVTERNLLQLNTSFGYEKYFKHDELSRWYVSSGSQLSFDIYVKDFVINLHDQFSYTQDSAREAAVANTGSYGTFQNTAGISGTWNLNDMTVSLGYDHQNELATSSQFNQINHTSEIVSPRVGLKLHPRLTVGVEGSATFTRYDQMMLNDNNAYSVGMYGDWHPDSFLEVQPSAGYSVFQFEHTSPFIQTSDLNSWYASLRVSHAITKAISYTIDAGHEIRLGIQSDAIEDWYVRPGANWSIVKDLTLGTTFSYEHGKQGQGNVYGNLTETYDYMGFVFNLGHPITKRLAVSLTYRLTVRSSSAASRDYNQNMVGLQLSYRQP